MLFFLFVTKRPFYSCQVLRHRSSIFSFRIKYCRDFSSFNQLMSYPLTIVLHFFRQEKMKNRLIFNGIRTHWERPIATYNTMVSSSFDNIRCFSNKTLEWFESIDRTDRLIDTSIIIIIISKWMDIRFSRRYRSNICSKVAIFFRVIKTVVSTN